MTQVVSNRIRRTRIKPVPQQPPVQYANARQREVMNRIREEAEHFDNKMFGEMFVTAMENKFLRGDSALFDFMQHLEQSPVDIETFLDSEEFLASTDLTVWPEVRRAIVDINRNWWKKDQAYIDALLMGATSTGKCLAKGTPVIMYDGSVKKVEDVAVGDQLMGPDSLPRTVLGLASGQEEMFRVTPYRGDPYTVNRSHILSLKVTGLGCNRHGNRKSVGLLDGRRFSEGELINVSVHDYLAANATFRHCVKGWRAPAIAFPDPMVVPPVDPYFVGVWLGDGTSKALSVTVADEEIQNYIRRYAQKLGLRTVDYTYGDRCKTLGVVAAFRGWPNKLLTDMHRLGLCLGEKFIPTCYKTASPLNRLKVLAGLLDTDGYYDKKSGGYEITTKSARLRDDILFLARSLGFTAVSKDSHKVCQNGNGGSYHRIWLSGDLEIPCLLKRKQGKRSSKRASQLSGIRVESVGEGDYYGFTLDGDGLFLLGDFTVTHNTEIAKVTTAYHVHILGCLRNPQTVYGLPRTTSIVFPIMAAKPHVTKRVVYLPLRKMIEMMPWFQKHMRIDKLVESEIYFTEKNIRIVMGGADSDSILGEAIIGGIIDEVNFMNLVLKSKKAEVSTGRAGIYDQAATIYEAMSRRKKGRFISQGPRIGIICTASSTRYKGDFTDKRKKQAIEIGEQTIYIYDKKQYEVWPKDRYSGETFRLLVGNDIITDTRVLKDDEKVPEGSLVLDVPIEYESDFLREPHDSLRDVVGMSTSSYSPFFRRRFKIMEAIQRGKENGLLSFLNKDNVILGVDGLPLVKSDHYCVNPSRPRYVHIDLSINGDRCGIAMVRFDGLQNVSRGTGDNATTESLPKATVEMAVSVEPDANNEISIAEIRSWVKQLRDVYGYPIRAVTYDGFESKESRQQWKKEGMRTGLMSVDKTSVPYKHLRDAINDGRIDLVENDVLVEELFSLEFDEVKDKIDHPPKGSKDVADAVCGCYFTLLQRRSSWMHVAEDDKEQAASQRAEYDRRYDGARA